MLPPLLLLVLAPPVAAESVWFPVPLPDLVDTASIVCIGRLKEVIEVPLGLGELSEGPPDPLPIAVIAVEQVLKGPPDLRVVYHEAWSPPGSSDCTGARRRWKAARCSS